MKILLLGANGQLGQELSRILPFIGEVKACDRSEVDLTNKQSILAEIDLFKPGIIVNAAAYTSVDKAESERELAFKVNAEAVGTLANEAAKRDIWLIHYSTDYVFDGKKAEPYLETDTPNPINVYGESKQAGEQAIIASACKYLIFRTSWVIGKDGSNFAKTILRLAIERDSLSVINDQFGVPTSSVLISKVTADAIEAIMNNTSWPSGIYHLASQGKTNWFGITKVLLELAAESKINLETSLKPVTTAEYPTTAKRPANSCLNTKKLQQQCRFDLPDWKVDFSATAKEIIKDVKTA